MRFSVHYGNPAELVADHDGQFVKGGFLVRVDPPAGLELYQAVDLELSTEAGSAVVTGQVVQIVAGVGVAVAFSPGDDVAELVAAARLAGAGGAPAEHAIGGRAKRPTAAPDAPSSAGAGAGKAALIHKARYGNKDERAQIMRGTDRTLHRYVLTNPGIGLDEVVFIAKMTTVAPDLLQAIADRREWAQRPDIAYAIVRNPKAPVPLAVKLLQYVAPGDLRQIAKMANVRMPIAQAARRLVLR